jgi:hypothetical protein
MPREPKEDANMSRGSFLPAVLGLALAGVACGHPEKQVVDNYFNAVRAKDNQTLSSFATARFERPVQSWAIKETLEENTEPMPLVALNEKLKQAEAAQAANTKEARTYNLDHFADIDQVRDLRSKGKPVPAKMSGVATKWDEFNQKDRETKKAVAEAKDAAEKEKRNMALSVGTTEGLEAMQGEVKTKKIAVDVTIEGQSQPYVMVLKRYEAKREGGPRVQSRWIIQSIQPRT